MDPQLLLWLILGILTLNFIADQVLDYLNLKSASGEIPKEVKDIYNEEEYKKSQAYLRANTRLGFVSSTFSFILIAIVVATGLLGKIESYTNQYLADAVFSSLLFFGILFLASDILSLPFSLYKTFVIEEKFGFNKTSVKLFFLDKLKGYFLAFLIGGAILWILLSLIQVLEQNFWIWFWLFLAAFMLLANMFYTSVIVPLFNKLTPLPEGELRQEIENYSQKEGFDLTNIYVLDNSKRSTKSNAYFSGIGKRKKVVLFDTLIKNHNTDELVAVLAHEIGHFKKGHITTGLIAGIIQTGILLFLLSWFIYNPDLSKALGGETNSVALNLVAFSFLYSPISQLIGIGMNSLSRKNEYEADSFAAKTYNGEALSKALKTLSQQNLSNLTPHPAYVYVHYSHPPLVSRLKNLKSIES